MKPFTKYEFKIINGKIKIEKKAKSVPKPTEISSSAKMKPRGCGKNITWKDCPRVSDELINSIFDTETLDLLLEE